MTLVNGHIVLLAAIVACFLCHTIVHAHPSHNDVDETYSFDQYVQDFAKTYSSPKDRLRREMIFVQNLHAILRHNRQNGPVSYKLGVNQFMDMESHELPTGYEKSFHPVWRGQKTPSATAERRQLRGGGGNIHVSFLLPHNNDLVLLERTILSVDNCLLYSFVVGRHMFPFKWKMFRNCQNPSTGELGVWSLQ